MVFAKMVSNFWILGYGGSGKRRWFERRAASWRREGESPEEVGDGAAKVHGLTECQLLLFFRKEDVLM
jgi:hypothetical protein